jgi:HEPN domain-containing protein
MPQPEHELLAVDWYHRAIHDLGSAMTLAHEDPSDPNAVWIAQQAAEKAIKCLLVLNQITFRKIHDLEALRALLPAQYKLRSNPADLSSLTKDAVETRYPGEFDSLDEAEVRHGLELATQVVDLLKEQFDQQILLGVDPATGQPY